MFPGSLQYPQPAAVRAYDRQPRRRRGHRPVPIADQHLEESAEAERDQVSARRPGGGQGAPLPVVKQDRRVRAIRVHYQNRVVQNPGRGAVARQPVAGRRERREDAGPYQPVSIGAAWPALKWRPWRVRFTVKHHCFPIRRPTRIPKLTAAARRTIDPFDSAGRASADIGDGPRRNPVREPFLTAAVPHYPPLTRPPFHRNQLHISVNGLRADNLEVLRQGCFVKDDSRTIRGPRGAACCGVAPGDPPDLRAVIPHYIDSSRIQCSKRELAVGGIAVGREREPLAIRGPCRAKIAAGPGSQIPRLAARHVQKPDVGAASSRRNKCKSTSRREKACPGRQTLGSSVRRSSREPSLCTLYKSAEPPRSEVKTIQAPSEESDGL